MPKNEIGAPLVTPYVEPFWCKNMTQVMFCAHDEQEHTVRWSEMAGGWMIENKVVGLVSVRDGRGSLFCALQSVGQYLCIAFEDFTITANPMHGE